LNSSHTNSPLQKEDGLNRIVGVWGLSANIVNLTVGAGIFVLPAIVAAGLGSASIAAYLFCGFLIALVMLCFAEVGSKVTDSGGAYTYIESAFGKYAGFLTANLFIVSALAASAAVANAIFEILATFIPVMGSGWARITFLVVLFGGLAWINVIGIKSGMRVIVFSTMAKLIPLLLLVLIGWKDVTGSNLIWESLPSVKSVGEMSLILFFAFVGAETGLSIGGEVKNPKKTIPKAVFIGVSGVLLLYMLIQTVSLGVMGDALADFQANPLAEVGNRIFGPAGLTLITLGAAVSMFGAVSGVNTNLPRVIFAGARDGVIPPKILARVHPKYITPHVAIILYSSVSFLLAFVGEIQALMIASSGAILLVFLGVAFSVIKLRKLQPNIPGSFTIPGGYTVPVVTSLVILWFLAHLTGPEAIGMAILVAVLTGVFFGMRWIRVWASDQPEVLSGPKPMK
jgi:basic amino acid/polyamine antiporter, APA family